MKKITTNSKIIPISFLQENTGQIDGLPKNPRLISDARFEQLCENLKKYPQFLELNKIIIRSFEEPIIVAGNMRSRALIANGVTEIPRSWIDTAENYSAEELKAFTIIDNNHFGEFDWEELRINWQDLPLDDWGLGLLEFEPTPDYSELSDDESVNNQLQEMQSNVKKAILIEFDSDMYDEAFELTSFFRKSGLEIGKFLVEKLRELKTTLPESQLPDQNEQLETEKQKT